MRTASRKFPPLHFGGNVLACLVDLLRNWSVYFSSCFEHSAERKKLKIDATQPKTRFSPSSKFPHEPFLPSLSKNLFKTRLFMSLGLPRRTIINLEIRYFVSSGIQMDLKSIIFWVWGSIVAFGVVLSGHSLLQKSVRQYRRSTYSVAKKTGGK